MGIVLGGMQTRRSALLGSETTPPDGYAVVRIGAQPAFSTARIAGARIIVKVS